MDNINDDSPVAQPIFNNLGPMIKEYLSGYILVGYRADNNVGVIVSDCPDIRKRDELKHVIKACEQWGNTKLYEGWDPDDARDEYR